MVALTDTALDAIRSRLDAWVKFGDPPPDPGDVTALLVEVGLMRRVHLTDVNLLNHCRDELSRVYDDYRAIADQLGAIDEQAAAEAGDPDAYPDAYREPGQ
jgi:hypothetical protein